MFSNKQRIKELEERIAKTDQVNTNLQDLNQQIVDSVKRSPMLVNIDVVGRSNVFTFLHNGEMKQIKFYSTMSDDVAGWKEMLGLPK